MSIPELWEHQRGAIEKARSLRNMAVFFEMGTGKTRTLIEILREKFTRHGTVLRTLIVCPTAVCPNWKNEIAMYSKIPVDQVHILDQPLKERAALYTQKSGIFITNFEAFANDDFAKTIQNNPPNILIIDESHRIKASSAKRTKELIKVSYAMEKLPLKHRYILTGSPVLNTEMDLFTQFLVLDCGKTFGKNFFAFRAQFFRDRNAYMPKQKHFPDWVPREGTTEKLKELIGTVSVLAKKEDCLDLPPLVKTVVDVELSREQKKLYEEMKKEFIAFVDKGVAVAQLAITKALRMQQILSGFLKLEDGSIHRIKDNPRAKALADILEDVAPNQKVIVWSIFHEDYATIRHICNTQGLKYVELTGEVTSKEAKQAALEQFKSDPQVRVMISSPAAGGTGVNMTSASVMIYYSKSYSLEHELQSESRNYRGGSEIHEKITRIDLCARGTIDEIILSAVGEKKDLSKNILELRNMLKGGL
jgi:SNF2 family DNA or RNA helicase